MCTIAAFDWLQILAFSFEFMHVTREIMYRGPCLYQSVPYLYGNFDEFSGSQQAS